MTYRHSSRGGTNLHIEENMIRRYWFYDRRYEGAQEVAQLLQLVKYEFKYDTLAKDLQSQSENVIDLLLFSIS